MNKYSEIIKNLLKKFNFKIEHVNSWYKRNEHSIAEIEDEELEIIKSITNYSMSTPANHWAIIQSIKHLKSHSSLIKNIHLNPSFNGSLTFQALVFMLSFTLLG